MAIDSFRNKWLTDRLVVVRSRARTECGHLENRYEFLVRVN